jgi:hypothetical protein
MNFIEREHAIEAHQALTDLAEFQTNLHRQKELGLRLAKIAGLDEAAAQRLATDLAEHFCDDPNAGSLKAYIDAALARNLAHLPEADIRAAMEPLGGPDQTVPASSLRDRTRGWISFVISQLLMLFGFQSDLQAGKGELRAE